MSDRFNLVRKTPLRANWGGIIGSKYERVATVATLPEARALRATLPARHEVFIEDTSTDRLYAPIPGD